MTRLILFLVRLKLGVKKCERFKFTNQKDNSHYYIDKRRVVKVVHKVNHVYVRDSGVSLNWLLSPECKIRKMEV